MNVLAELHQEADLKLNLKFEIEVLCKNLSLDVAVSFHLFTLPNAVSCEVGLKSNPFAHIDKHACQRYPGTTVLLRGNSCSC